MTLNEVCSKNVTSAAVCEVLGSRQRNRPEPLALNRLEADVRRHMASLGIPYNRHDYFECINGLARAGWGRVIKTRFGRPQKMEFSKSITELKQELSKGELAPLANKGGNQGLPPTNDHNEVTTEVTTIDLPMSTMPKPLRTQFKFEVEGGTATINIEGDVEQVMMRLKLIL